MRRQRSLWTRLVALFLLWSSLRAVWSVLLAEVDPNYRLASELGFGALFVGGQVVYALVGVTAAAAVWWRWRSALPLGSTALAIYAAMTVSGLLQMRSNPVAAKNAYAASREARGLPVRPERLDELFSPTGQRFAWAIGALLCFGPLVVLWWHQDEFTE
jgi:hypothetical protein